MLVGLAERVLNIPDRVRLFYQTRDTDFETETLPRLSTGDATLWKDFDWAISYHRVSDPEKTVERLRTLPTRNPAHTHVAGYAYILLVPVFITNVDRPTLPRPNSLGIDVDQEYSRMLDQVCAAYTTRWAVRFD